MIEADDETMQYLMALVNRLETATPENISDIDIEECLSKFPDLLAFASHIPLSVQMQIIEKNPNDICLIQRSILDKSIINIVYEKVDKANSVAICYLNGDETIRIYLTLKFPAFIEMIPPSAKKRDLIDGSDR